MPGVTDKIDFKRTLAAYRARPGEFSVIDMPELRYLMIDGQGDPNTSPAFAEAIESLYPLAYRLKFASKRILGRDYAVPPLEALWWAEDMRAFTSARDKHEWQWTLMLMVPEWIAPEMFAEAVAELGAKRPPARLADIRLEGLTEGRCVQTLHIGSFEDETAVLARMHEEVIPGLGLRLTGRHHEIYLSDFRRVPPERQRTILRQPVVAAQPASDPDTGRADPPL